jgi:hypothetical protein
MANVSLCITTDPVTEVLADDDRVKTVLPAPDTIVLLTGLPRAVLGGEVGTPKGVAITGKPASFSVKPKDVPINP